MTLSSWRIWPEFFSSPCLWPAAPEGRSSGAPWLWPTIALPAQNRTRSLGYTVILINCMSVEKKSLNTCCSPSCRYEVALCVKKRIQVMAARTWSCSDEEHLKGVTFFFSQRINLSGCDAALLFWPKHNGCTLSLNWAISKKMFPKYIFINFLFMYVMLLIMCWCVISGLKLWQQQHLPSWTAAAGREY